MTRIDVRARVQEPARVEERLRKLLVGGGFLICVMQDGGEAAVARGAEREALNRVRAVAGAVIHFAARQHELDWPAGHARAERGKGDMRPEIGRASGRERV